jgi:hypothetical protein
MLAPFCLRRLKRDVLKQMVGKRIVVLKLELAPEQRGVYTDIVEKYIAKKLGSAKQQREMQAAAKEGGGKAKRKAKDEDAAAVASVSASAGDNGRGSALRDKYRITSECLSVYSYSCYVVCICVQYTLCA